MTAAAPAVSRIVLATQNAGKLREVAALFEDQPFELVALSTFPGVVLPEEGEDYAENAAVKARTAAEATGLPALGDDSGIEVAALDGRPGPLSARYGGEGLDAAGRNARLLAELAGVRAGERAARFYCVVALARPDGRVEIVTGECRGEILEAPSGSAGFGYDPIFRPEGYDVSMAEVGEAEKNRISHRGRAFAALRPRLAELSRELRGSARADG